MKISKTKSLPLLFLALISAISCQTAKAPQVADATYESFSTNQEKGYLVNFTLSDDNMWPKAVVLNKIQHEIQPGEKNGLNYSVRMLAESRALMGFRPQISDRNNGILFKKDSTEIYKEVEFKLKD